jgi:hypothetical protein
MIVESKIGSVLEVDGYITFVVLIIFPTHSSVTLHHVCQIIRGLQIYTKSHVTMEFGFAVRNRVILTMELWGKMLPRKEKSLFLL